VPAIQLHEHAKAILADDAANGFQRNDPALRQMAASAHNAAACLQK